MSQPLSPSTGRKYGMVLVCKALDVARSTVYGARACRQGVRMLQQRGPRTEFSDAELTERIRVLAPTRAGGARGPALHDGTIIPAKPNEMSGTDATSVMTLVGAATVFIAADHATAECVGIHAAKRGSRFEALEPLRQGIKRYFGAYGTHTAAGLTLRHDHGSQYVSDDFQDELRFLAIASRPAIVRTPEGNGCSERFIRTLKEQLLWVHTFDSVEALRLALVAFRDRYNREWILERHGFLTPEAARQRLLPVNAAAA